MALDLVRDGPSRAAALRRARPALVLDEGRGHSSNHAMGLKGNQRRWSGTLRAQA